VQRFNPRLKVVVVKTMATLGALTVAQVQAADVVIVAISVLRSDLYFERMLALAGEHMVTTTKAARYFDQLYATAVSKLEARVSQMQEGVFEPAGTSAMPEVLEQKKRLIGAALVAEPKSAKPAKEAKSVGDPRGLNGLRDVRKIKCPPFELFHFERVVVDEFTYLPHASRERVVVTKGLSCGARWCLSGTPPVGSFDDVRGIADFVGVYLGAPDAIDKAEQTRAEAFLFYASSHTPDWHARRRRRAQAFLDQFVRQNIAEIDEIPFVDTLKRVSLAPAERAIYLELEHHLAAMEMRQKRSKRSGAASGGDREVRLRSVLGKSKTPDEALLKRCSHFDLEGSGGTAAEVCEAIVLSRERQLDECKAELRTVLSEVFAKEADVQTLDAGFELGEDLEQFDPALHFVRWRSEAVCGLGDPDATASVLAILADAEVSDTREPLDLARFARGELDKKTGERAPPVARAKPLIPGTDAHADAIKDAKWEIRKDTHDHVRAVARELVGRIRSLRYFKAVRDHGDGEGEFSRAAGTPAISRPCSTTPTYRSAAWRAARPRCARRPWSRTRRWLAAARALRAAPRCETWRP
jgi:hypothetical protein